MIPHLSSTLQRFRTAMASPIPVPLDQLTEAMTSLSKFVTNARFLAAQKKHVSALKQKRQPAKKQAATKKKKSSKPKPAHTATAASAGCQSDLGSSEPSDSSHPEDSEESEIETNITLKDIKVNDSIVWGANGEMGKVLLCVGLVTKKRTRGASSLSVTYLLPVSMPSGTWLGEKLSCNKYRKEELDSEAIRLQVFLQN